MFLNPWYGGPQQLEVSSLSEGLLDLTPNEVDLVELKKFLDERQSSLAPGWTIHLLRDGRYFYCNHASQTSSWLPPLENWENGTASLPYGWESAVDKEGKAYYINHLTKTTTYEDPREDLQEEPPKPRQVDLTRDPDMGFGFVAGSEKPVIVRFVTDNGPSVDRLLPGDQILIINGEDVKRAPRDHVIQLVRSCKENVSLTVCQPPLDNSSRKSALLSAAKKQRLKSNPSRVRFAESVDINGSNSLSPSQISSSESTTPFMPNVLKVFLENGQTKSFKYDSSTTVGDVLESLHQKLGIKCPEHFSLVVEHVKSLRRNKLTLLDPKETLSNIASRPGAQLLRCLYRITFVPREAYDLLRNDSVAFEYLYLQCCNDVIQERFSPELKYDVALRLASLHIHQHALSAGGASSKLSLKTIEKECGLDRFLPGSLVDSMKRKELRKLLSHFMKLHGSFTAPGQKQLTALQAKLHYLKIISELPSYGAKCFSTNVMEGNVEAVILISPRFGISQISGAKSSLPEALCEIEQVTCLTVTREDELSKRVELDLKHPDKENLVLSLEDRESEEFILVLQGYYKLLTEKSLEVNQNKDGQSDLQAPTYHSRHRVGASGWNYINGSDSEDAPPNSSHQRVADFGLSPPYQRPPDSYQMPNGHIARANEANVRYSIANIESPYLDSNMNRTNSVYENAGDGRLTDAPIGSFKGTSAANLHKDDKKVLYPSPETQSGGSDGQEGPLAPGVNEARNVQVIKRVAEMHQLVEDAETYLSDVEGETTDVESVRSESYGKLKHSDSLLLLTQGQKLLSNGEVETGERSESDTDSQSTPSTSPAHKTEGMKSSGSSFGLHSPDNLPIHLENPDNDIKALIRQLEDNSGLPYTFAEGTLYLDPDIIDLTMIPPPITPDEDGAKMLPPQQLNAPPTPFADRESLDQELKALEKDVGDLRSLTNINWKNEFLRISSSSPNAGASDTDDTMSLSSTNTSRDSSLVRRPLNLQNLLKKGGIGGPGFTLAALRQLGFNLTEGEDIDSFIANLTIPPPPEGSNELTPYLETRELGADYDIAAYIIPPPPSNSTNDHRSSDIIRRLYEAKEGISRVVGNTYSFAPERDKDIYEVRVKSEQVTKEQILPGRVASLQRHFEGGNKTRMLLEFNQHSLKMNKTPKLSTIDNLSSTSSLRLNGCKTGMESRLYEAYDENDKLLRSFDSHNRDWVPDIHTPPLSPRMIAFDHNSSKRESPKRPGTLSTSSEYPFSSHSRLIQAESSQAPPPPRALVTHADQMAVTSRNSALKRISSPQSCPPASAISKSASQGDIASCQAYTNAIHGTSSRWDKSSVSNEDIRGNSQTSPGSPSKQSNCSSNDSLDSSSSTATVKSVSSKSFVGEEKPPELPPRSASKTNLKPPIPRSPSQENCRVASPMKVTRTQPPVSKSSRSTSPEIAERPPAIPSRLTKPASPPTKLSSPQRVGTFQKAPAPQPPVLLNGTLTSLNKGNLQGPPQRIGLSNKFPQSITSSSTNASGNILMHPPETFSPRNNITHREVPLLTSSPKSHPKAKLQIGKANLSTDLDDSLDSGSFEQDSLEETEEVEAMPLASREAYKRTANIINESIKRLNKIISSCSKASKVEDNSLKDSNRFQVTKDALTSESRQFVTASKLFVKSATESENVLLESLSKCMSILQEMVNCSFEIVSVTTTPLQTQSVIIKVRDVVGIYLSTVRAALSAAGRGMDHPSMNSLMIQATSLAGVLTSLMRTLRVFSP